MERPERLVSLTAVKPSPLRPLIISMAIMLGLLGGTMIVRQMIQEAQEMEQQKLFRQQSTAQRMKEMAAEAAALKAKNLRENELRLRANEQRKAEAAAQQEKTSAARKADLASRRRISVKPAVQALFTKAENGDPEAQYLAGILSRSGLGAMGTFNPDGTPNALYPQTLYPVLGENLSRPKPSGLLFVDLPDLPPDEAAAHRWFLRAALQGHGAAQVELARECSFTGPHYDLTEALKWYLLSEAMYVDATGLTHSNRYMDDTGSMHTAKTPAGGHHYIPEGLVNAAEMAEAKKRAAAFMPKKESP